VLLPLQCQRRRPPSSTLAPHPLPSLRPSPGRDLRKNHGKEEARARDLFYALWIPDLFMERVEVGGCGRALSGVGSRRQGGWGWLWTYRGLGIRRRGVGGGWLVER
jgi:hypothetical protein